MRRGTPHLALVFAIATIGWLLVQRYGRAPEPAPYRAEAETAARLATRAFAAVDSVKRARGMEIASDTPVRWRALLGGDYTPLTTTLGSREAKEVSTNPAWAALLVGMLTEAGVRPGDTVGILGSGSFPALVLSALSAVSALEAEPLLMVSLGASSYGANQREATILDLMDWVRRSGVLDPRSALASPGGEDDAGGGMSREGRTWLAEAAARNGTELVRFGSLAEAIAARTELMSASRVAAVVNIGGGQAALGRCPHTAVLPVGIWREVPDCRCVERGALVRMAEAGVPAIHLLSVRRLAAWHGLDYEPGACYNDNGVLTTRLRPQKPWILAALTAILLPLVVAGRTRQ
ncbi:MAG: poly-gamma-glutamate system protein [bacterium]|nr:poly-gamma-glutamate system protein [bacterium]